MSLRRILLCCLLLLTGLAVPATDGAGRRMGIAAPGLPGTFNVTVPAHDFDLMLARPEKHSVTMCVLAYQDLEGFIAYGTQPGACTVQSPLQQFKKGVPVALVMGALQADTRYYYQFRYRVPGAVQFTAGPEYTFRTARAPGSSFTFTLTADAHLDEHTSPAVYRRALDNIRADQPDFHLDLGNLFMTDKHASRDEAASQYLAQRYYLGQIGAAIPILLAQGTHDGESGKYDDGSENCLAVWSNLLRKRYFPNPVTGRFLPREQHVPTRAADCCRIITPGNGAMRSSSCSIPSGIPPGSVAPVTAGHGRWARRNIAGSHLRWSRARRNINSSSSITCSAATRRRAAAWKWRR